MLTVLDLFSGIGGFSLGLERTGGFKTVAFCEIDPFCRKVLAKHWPGVPIYDDITTADFTAVRAEVICGGFPCQDISSAGKRAGITGERSGLWQYMVGAVRLVRPRYVVVENVAALLGNGLDAVLGDLAAIGYDAEWHCIPASAIGAPHRRDRWWGIAYPQAVAPRANAHGARPHRAQIDQQGEAEFRDEQIGLAGSVGEDVAHANGFGCSGRPETTGREARAVATGSGRLSRREVVADTRGARLATPQLEALLRTWGRDEGRAASERGWWGTEPDVGRVAHGVPSRVDRIRALGNAVVPQIPELIGRAILKAEGIEVKAA